MTMKSDLVFDIIEGEADEKYYIDDAPDPAVLLLTKGNFLARRSWQVYINRLTRVTSTKEESEAREKIEQIFNSCKKRIKVFKVLKYGRRRGEKILHGEYGPLHSEE